MTDTKHTPGPWHVGVKPSPMVYGPKGEQVVPLNVLLDLAEVEANASLIASAPDLLAALRGLVEGAEECLSHVQRALSPEIAQARTAIARAEGK